MSSLLSINPFCSVFILDKGYKICYTYKSTKERDIMPEKQKDDRIRWAIFVKPEIKRIGKTMAAQRELNIGDFVGKLILQEKNRSKQ